MTHVLVVDDEPDIRMLARMSLDIEGHEVTEATSGEQALEMLRDGARPDLLLLDLRLPGVDGWQVLRRLRAIVGLEDLPVVIMSAHASPGREAQARAASATAYLVKPFKQQDLVRLVNKHAH